MTYGLTDITVCADGRDLGRRAAASVSDAMRRLLEEKDGITVIYAAGESQGTFLEALASEPGIAWDRVDCFNMDDFWDPGMPERFTCGFQTLELIARQL